MLHESKELLAPCNLLLVDKPTLLVFSANLLRVLVIEGPLHLHAFLNLGLFELLFDHWNRA